MDDNKSSRPEPTAQRRCRSLPPAKKLPGCQLITLANRFSILASTAWLAAAIAPLAGISTPRSRRVGQRRVCRPVAASPSHRLRARFWPCRRHERRRCDWRLAACGKSWAALALGVRSGWCGSACRRHPRPGNARHRVRRRRRGGPDWLPSCLRRPGIFARHQGGDLRVFLKRQDGLAVGVIGGVVAAVGVDIDRIAPASPGRIWRHASSPAPARSDRRTGTGRPPKTCWIAHSALRLDSRIAVPSR